jgi:hypothetical protein
MLAFAKDTRVTDHVHPEEKNNSKLKEYMDYQRSLNHDLIVYHSLDHAKAFLQRNIDESASDRQKVQEYLEKAFPSSHGFADADTLLLMLRKLINAQNSTSNWYRLNEFYFAVVYDCLDRFIKIYNRLLKENPEKAKDYNLSPGVEIDFDDWVQLYFHSLDFLIGRPFEPTHFMFRRRNRAVEEALQAEMRGGKSKNEALDKIQGEFEIDPSAIKILRGEKIGQTDQELFYTSTENPLYEHLYDPDSEYGLMDEESLVDHHYFIGFQIKGLDWEQAEALFKEIDNLTKK